MALVWDKTLYDEMYSAPFWRHGVRGTTRIPRLHYHYWPQLWRIRQTVERLVALPGFAQVSHLAIVGGGFGWTAEVLGEYGINAISVDTSDFIVANENVSEEAEIRQHLTEQGFDPDNLFTCMDPADPNRELPASEVWGYLLHPSGGRTSIPIEQEDISNGGGRNKVKQRLNNNLDGILSEFVLDSMEADAESLSVAEGCEQLRPNPAVPVIHMVGDSAEGDPRLNNKTMADWRALLDANGFSGHYVCDAAGRYL